MRIAVTGSSGFIGTNLVDWYLQNDVDILALDHKQPKITRHNKCFYLVDLLDSDTLGNTIANFDPDVIIHLGARTDLVELPGLTGYEANTDGVRNLIAASHRCKRLRLIVFASTRLVFAINHKPKHDWDYSPSTTYGRSKIEGERIVRNPSSGPSVPWVIVRPTSIWGPWFDVPYRTFFDLIQKGRYIHPRHKLIYKSFGFVGNAVHQIVRIAETKPEMVHGKALFLADYDPIEVSDWAERIRAAMGAPKIRQLPLSLLRAIALTGDALKVAGMRNPPLTSFRLDNLTTEMVYNLIPTKDIVGSLPFTVDQGIDLTVKWMSDQFGFSLRDTNP